MGKVADTCRDKIMLLSSKDHGNGARESTSSNEMQLIYFKETSPPGVRI